MGGANRSAKRLLAVGAGVGSIRAMSSALAASILAAVLALAVLTAGRAPGSAGAEVVGFGAWVLLTFLSSL
ncbi:hypothetical protein AT984_15865 [Paucibacter sp. KCTC 42545]|nr:hypothetical protein AT984_15865 [Paucibacter sp. KCTC 42545]